MKSYQDLAKQIEYRKIGSKVLLASKPNELELVGEGRSAFAFKVSSTNKVIKVYFPTHVSVVKEEAEVYRVLSNNPYFPRFYEAGENYIVIDYIEGKTLFTCLQMGIPIKPEHIFEVDKALKSSEESGLNPADIHLKNIIISSTGEVKLIDVARFRQKKRCRQWYDLKKAYGLYRRQLFPKQLPTFLLNLVAFLYKKRLLPSWF